MLVSEADTSCAFEEQGIAGDWKIVVIQTRIVRYKTFDLGYNW